MLRAELQASQEQVTTLTLGVRIANDRADAAEAGVEAARTVSSSPRIISSAGSDKID